jgi:DNA-binding NarL/FixJ family response regulator
MLNEVKRLDVCVVGRNPLAVRYLEYILRGAAWVVNVSPDAMVRTSNGAGSRLFIIDGVSIRESLLQLLRISSTLCSERRHLLVDVQRRADGLVDLVRNGLHGFVAHDNVQDRLVPALLALKNQSLWIPRDTLRLCMDRCGPSTSQSCHVDEITEREREILALVKWRLSNKEIATHLRIQESTVKFHLSNIFAKLKVSNRRCLFSSPEPIELPFGSR